MEPDQLVAIGGRSVTRLQGSPMRVRRIDVITHHFNVIRCMLTPCLLCNLPEFCISSGWYVSCKKNHRAVIHQDL